AFFSEPATQSSLSERGMNFAENPVVENTFSLPRDVFERLWSSQQSVSDTSSTSTSYTRNPASANTTGQCRRLSGGLNVTELTGSKAKRPRLSISEQALTQREHLQREQQKQLKLQLIMQKLENTREKVQRLLQLQKARGRPEKYRHNSAEKSIDLESFQRRYVLLKRRANALNSLRRSIQDKVPIPPAQSQFQGSRCVPGINLVTSGAWSKEHGSGYSYDSFHSAGLALDHGTYPRIVAVHCVMDRAAVKAVHQPYQQKDKPPYASVPRKSDYVYKKNDFQKNGTFSRLTNASSSSVENFRTCEGDEVVLTKVIPGKKERKQQEVVNLANCSQRARDNNKHLLENAAVPDDATHLKDRQETFVHRVDIGQLTTVSHPEYVVIAEEHTRHVKQSGNVDNQVSKDNTPTKQAELSQKQQNGPPPYLPVLDKTRMMEREKEVNQERPVSTASSAHKLAKTVLEISEKIVQTRERIKNETIDWKKCVLFKLEKRLIQKLRRAERLTGQRTEIEDLRDEVPGPVTNGKKGKVQGQRKRSSRKDNQPESTCATDGDADKSQGHERSLSRQCSMSDSVTDDETVDCHGREKRSSVSDIGCESEQMKNRQLDSVTECVTEENEKRPACSQDQKKEEAIEYPQMKKIEENPTFENEMQCNYSTEKYSNDQNDKISSAQEKNIERCIGKYELDHGEKCDPGVKKKSEKIENQVDICKEHGQVDGKATLNTNSNCVTVELSQAASSSTKRESSFIDNASRQKTESCHEKSEKQLLLDKDKRECVTVRSETREDHQPKERKNLFEIFKSRFQGTNTLSNSSVLTAEKNCKSNQNVVELIKSANGLSKKLQSCGKEDHKSVSLDCDRNIWSTLMKDGIS
ncbi:unnamed protein product, partial [Porites evermanni]